MKHKRNLVHLFLGLDAALLLVAVVIFGYIFASVRERPSEAPTTTPAPTPQATEAETPSPSPTQTPSPSPTPEPLAVYETEQFRVSYQPQRLTLSDRSGEVGRTSVALTSGGLELPRVDIQVLEGMLGISRDDFQLLAQAAASGYFAGGSPETEVLDMVMEETGYTAELQIAATEASPALRLRVRLIPGTAYGVLAICLTPEGTDQETQDSLLEALQSVTCGSE